MAVTTPTIYRSTDTGAPIVTAARGSIVNLLTKCLVNGYGSTRATATITSSGVNVSNNDTVTMDGTVYTFKTALTPAANEVLIGASAAASLTNLAAAMGNLGTSGTTYGAGTQHQTNLQVTSVTSTVITLTAHTGGTGGNSLALAKSAATLTLSGATFSGGSGSDTTSSVGWSLVYNTDISKGVFRAPSGRRFYYRVLDDNSLTGIGRDFVVRGAESMSDVNTATNFFPTVAQLSDANNSARKSTTSDSTNRAWTVWADDRTVYVFIATGDSGSLSHACGFGDTYSFVTSDSYNGFCHTRGASTASTTTSGAAGMENVSNTQTATTAQANFYQTRKAIGTGGGEASAKFADLGVNSSFGATNGPAGTFVYPNTADSKLHMTRVYIIDCTNGTCRGWLRGLYAAKHAASNFTEGDTATGTTLADVSFSGKSFVVGPKMFSLTVTSVPYFLETSATVEVSP